MVMELELELERYPGDKEVVSSALANNSNSHGGTERYSGNGGLVFSNSFGRYSEVKMDEQYNIKSSSGGKPVDSRTFLKASLFCFVILFAFLIIIKGLPSSSSYQQYSIALHQEHSSSKEYLIKKFPAKRDRYDDNDDDKLLGGLLPAGLNENSCLSRYRWNLYRPRRNKTSRRRRKPSPYLISKLRDYETLHKHCGPKTAAYNTAYMILQSGASDAASSANYCKYVIWSQPPGLGNRMLSLVSSFLYALLTNRVLLLRPEGDMSHLFCEPFPEGSWLLPSDHSFGGFQVFHPSFPYRYGNMVKNHSTINEKKKSFVPPIMYINLNNHYDDADKHFFCEDQDQTVGVHLGKVTWLLIASNQYFVPSLFLMPSFQKQLEQLFPEKETVFHHLGRYLFHPTNDVWGLVTRYYDSYLSQADEKLGIQIRVFNDKAAQEHPHHILDQILGCTIQQNLLPKLHDQYHQKKEYSSSIKTRKAVLITSLRSIYYEELRNMYWQNGSNSEQVVVSFYQPSHEEMQQSGNEIHDMKALAEMYLLSLTDKLVISGWSTFGYVAHALGGLQPWILHYPLPPQDTSTIASNDHFCKLSLSMEPCFHFPPSRLDCGKGRRNDTSTILPYVRHCEDATLGLMLFDS